MAGYFDILIGVNGQRLAWDAQKDVRLTPCQYQKEAFTAEISALVLHEIPDGDWSRQLMKTLDVLKPELALRNPEIYPERPSRIDVVETHLSWVFLTDRYAYKLRKPVRYQQIDFTTLPARFFDAQQEVRLNHRLAPDVYLGVVPLTWRTPFGLRVEGGGQVVQWLVKMRRLPAERMMDYLIHRSLLTRDDLIRVGQHLANFYKTSVVTDIHFENYLSQFRAEMSKNQAFLLSHSSRLFQNSLELLLQFQSDFVKKNESIFRSRFEEGRIVDGHGDLRPEHICIETDHEVSIFDCLEFDRNLRIVDAVDELSFLSLESERIGGDVGSILFSKYCETTGDNPPDFLVKFFKVHRACVWTRLALMRLEEESQKQWMKWVQRAQRYLDLANKYATMLDQDFFGMRSSTIEPPE